MSKLFIFTRKFPYGKAEAFLETEIKFLSISFEEIVVFPMTKDNYIRKTPSNVKVNNAFIDSNSFLERLFSYVSLFFKSVFYFNLKKNLNQIKSLNDFKRLLSYVYYEYKILETKFDDKFKGNVLMYSYWFNQVTNGLVKYKKVKNRDWKIVTRAHRWDIYEDEGFFPNRQLNLDSIDKVYSISADGKKYFQNKYAISNQKIEISRLGVFDKNSLSKKSSQRELVVVSVSQITKRKRVLFLLEALECFVKKNSSNMLVRWIHFGSGDQSSILDEKVRDLNLEHLEVDLKGYVNNSEIYTFYKKNEVDVFINLSESEGVPVSIMEAQSFGIPVVATNVGGTAEIVTNEVGVLLPAKPQLDQVVDALNLVIKSNFSSTCIKSKWNEKSNAESNYKTFSEDLLELAKVSK